MFEVTSMSSEDGQMTNVIQHSGQLAAMPLSIFDFPFESLEDQRTELNYVNWIFNWISVGVLPDSKKTK